MLKYTHSTVRACLNITQALQVQLHLVPLGYYATEKKQIFVHKSSKVQLFQNIIPNTAALEYRLN